MAKKSAGGQDPKAAMLSKKVAQLEQLLVQMTTPIDHLDFSKGNPTDHHKHFANGNYIKVNPGGDEVTMDFGSIPSPFVSLPGDPTINNDSVVVIGQPTTFRTNGTGLYSYGYQASITFRGKKLIFGKRDGTDPEIIIDNDNFFRKVRKRRRK
jgi:hypothetical protein